MMRRILGPSVRFPKAGTTRAGQARRTPVLVPPAKRAAMADGTKCSAGGTVENNPGLGVLGRRGIDHPGPVGTTEDRFQPCLRHSGSSGIRNPGLEVLGYSRPCLRHCKWNALILAFALAAVPAAAQPPAPSS